MGEIFAIRPLEPGEVDAALGLVWRVFLEFEAPDYGEEGVREFKEFIEPQEIRQKCGKNSSGFGAALTAARHAPCCARRFSKNGKTSIKSAGWPAGKAGAEHGALFGWGK